MTEIKHIRIVFTLEWELPINIESHEIFALLKKKYPKVIQESTRFWIDDFQKKIEIDWKKEVKDDG